MLYYIIVNTISQTSIFLNKKEKSSLSTHTKYQAKNPSRYSPRAWLARVGYVYTMCDLAISRRIPIVMRTIDSRAGELSFEIVHSLCTCIRYVSHGGRFRRYRRDYTVIASNTHFHFDFLINFRETRPVFIFKFRISLTNEDTNDLRFSTKDRCLSVLITSLFRQTDTRPN